ncbi:MAG: DUF192 domain-containing protein [Candidatus Sungbacteria bacterium]|nr:DUF192 domain-containing protein [Candidatus Sungbacteria bacterium]
MEIGFRGFIIFIVVVGGFILAGVGVGVSHMAALGILKMRGAQVTIGERTFIRAEVVTSVADRARGLSGRTGLPDGKGMLFVTEKPERQVFWMKSMRIPIDIVWIRDGTVIGMQEKVPIPPLGTPDVSLKRYPSPGPVDRVLEVRSGFVEDHRVKVGDAVSTSGL